MNKSPKLLLIDSSVLPEVFLRVIEAKKMLAKGSVKNSTEACKAVNLSRSAFYKYKDSVFTYVKENGVIITYNLILNDEPGVLSAVLTELYESGVNVLTINQNIPVDGVAPVSISIRTDNLKLETDQLFEKISMISGVVSIKQISAE